MQKAQKELIHFSAEKEERKERKVPIHFSAEKVPGVFLPPAAYFLAPFPWVA
jgi:hypothetical protein